MNEIDSDDAQDELFECSDCDFKTAYETEIIYHSEIHNSKKDFIEAHDNGNVSIKDASVNLLNDWDIELKTENTTCSTNNSVFPGLANDGMDIKIEVVKIELPLHSSDAECEYKTDESEQNVANLGVENINRTVLCNERSMNSESNSIADEKLTNRSNKTKKDSTTKLPKIDISVTKNKYLKGNIQENSSIRSPKSFLNVEKIKANKRSHSYKTLKSPPLGWRDKVAAGCSKGIDSKLSSKSPRTNRIFKSRNDQVNIFSSRVGIPHSDSKTSNNKSLLQQEKINISRYKTLHNPPKCWGDRVAFGCAMKPNSKSVSNLPRTNKIFKSKNEEKNMDSLPTHGRTQTHWKGGAWISELDSPYKKRPFKNL